MQKLEHSIAESISEFLNQMKNIARRNTCRIVAFSLESSSIPLGWAHERDVDRLFGLIHVVIFADRSSSPAR